jgi:tetratricopeptide (TPR) repeat protein
MTGDRSSGGPRPVKVEDVMACLPGIPELSPLLPLLVAASRPDPDRRWAGSGELGAAGDRVLDARRISRGVEKLSKDEVERTREIWSGVEALLGAIAGGEWKEVVDLLLEQGDREERRGRIREAESWYVVSHRLAREHRLRRMPEALRRAARVARGTGRLEEAALRYEEAWREASELELQEDQIIAATGRGNVAVDRGRWEEARSWYERGLELIGPGDEPRRERWQLLQNLAIVQRRSGELREVRRILRLAREEGERLADPDARVEVGNGWGQLLLAEGDYRGAELFFSEALSEARSSRARVVVRVNLGEALLLQGRALEAGEVAREAEAEALSRGVLAKLPEVYRLLAVVAHARGASEPFVLLEKALDLILSEGLPPFEEAMTRRVHAALRMAEGDDARAREEERKVDRILADLDMELPEDPLLGVIGGHGDAPSGRNEGVRHRDHEGER